MPVQHSRSFQYICHSETAGKQPRASSGWEAVAFKQSTSVRACHNSVACGKLSTPLVSSSSIDLLPVTALNDLRARLLMSRILFSGVSHTPLTYGAQTLLLFQVSLSLVSSIVGAISRLLAGSPRHADFLRSCYASSTCCHPATLCVAVAGLLGLMEG